MSKTYRPHDPEQQLLMPAALQVWLPPEHMAYLISDAVEELDLSVIMARYEGEERGGPPYHPRMLVKVLLYGYCTGEASSMYQRCKDRFWLSYLLRQGVYLMAADSFSTALLARGWE